MPELIASLVAGRRFEAWDVHASEWHLLQARCPGRSSALTLTLTLPLARTLTLTLTLTLTTNPDPNPDRRCSGRAAAPPRARA
jgi:hypothetical protein